MKHYPSSLNRPRVPASRPSALTETITPAASASWRHRLGKAFCLAATLAGSLFAAEANAATAYLLTTDNKLVALPTANTAATQPPIAITGLVGGNEVLVGIDVRPQNQQLYALGVDAINNVATLYKISPETGVAKIVGGTASQIKFTTDGVTQVDLPDPATVGWDIDFNPAADRLRVVAGGLTFRVDPNTGLGVDGNNGGGATTGTNPDGAIGGFTTTVDGAAYTNNQPNTGVTTLYTLDSVNNNLYIQNPPNAGTQTSQTTVTLGGSTLDFSLPKGFDIVPGVDAATSNAAVTTGSGFAVLTVGGVTGLYSINLVNGQSTLVGNLDPTLNVRSFAIRTELGAAIALDTTGAQPVVKRFSTADPGTVSSVTLDVTNLASGETLVGIDCRPDTGQFYALGINGTANTGTLYLLDPQNLGASALTPVGTTGQIAFVTTGGTPIDLPDPATAGYGIDFNPTVDRLRVVTSTGLNFRVNPISGAAVDNDGNSGNGTNPDGNINGLPGGSTGVSATAYTNAFGGTTVTTQYTLDAASDRLFIQNPPNNGTETSGLAITLGGSPLDITDLNGFDIPAPVRVGTSNTPVAGGDGWFIATVSGTTGLYRLNLVTGEATFAGAVFNGLTQLSGLVVNAVAALQVEFPFQTAIYDTQQILDYGTVIVGDASPSKEIFIRNTGSQALTYTASLTTGSVYTITGGGSGTIAPGAFGSVTVEFEPTALGPIGDALHIVNNDPAAPSFDLSLKGTGGATSVANDAVTVTGSGGNVYVLANDNLGPDVSLTAVSVTAPQVTINPGGRSIFVPTGFTGTFTYTASDGTSFYQGTVTVTGATPVTSPTTYFGLLLDPAGNKVGSAKVSVSSKNVATVQLVGGTSKATAKVTLASGTNAGAALTSLGYVALTRNANNSVTLGLAALGGSINGTLRALQPVTAAAKYHIALASVDPTFPGGSYAIATVSKKGAVAITGLLPDGLPFSAASGLIENSSFSFYSPVTKAKPTGTVTGELGVADLPTTDITGELAWLKLPQLPTVKGVHLGGTIDSGSGQPTPVALTAKGSLFDGTALLPAGTVGLILSGGNLVAPESTPVIINTKGIPAVPTGSLKTWTGVNIKVGKFSATVAVPTVAKPVKGSGLYLPKSGQAWGYFPGTSVGGLIQLIVP